METPTANRSLAPGFVPDPLVLEGAAGGPVMARTLGPSCLGYVPRRPSQVVRLSETFPRLRLVVSADVDTTLAIRRPDGTFVCDDDGGEGLNALIELEDVGPGTLQLWVGTYDASESRPYVLGVTAGGHVTASTLRGGGAAPMQPMQPTPPSTGVIILEESMDESER